MPRSLAGALLAAVTIALAGCGGPPMDAGTVMSKQYDDPDSWTQLVCSHHDGKGTCIMWMPVVHNDGPHWTLKLRNDSGQQGEREVTQVEYDAAKVGEWFDA
jgi:hypothetical protein